MAINRPLHLLTLFSAVASLCACGGGGAASDSGVNTPPPAPAPSPASTATLNWNTSTAADTTGYRVYYGTSPGAYAQARGAGVNAGSATSYTATGLVSGRTYYFSVTAYDAAGNESGFSGEVSKVVE